MMWIDQGLDARADLFYPEGLEEGLHRTSLEVEGSFFKLIICPAPDMLDADQPLQGVTLLFSFVDLYLLGFLHDNIWYVFDDARLEGSGHLDEGNDRYWKTLGFNGGYNSAEFTSVPLGLFELNLTHHTLSQYLQRLKKGQQDEVKKCLFRIIFAIAEAKRFPHCLQTLHDIFSSGTSRVVGVFIDHMCKNWSKSSKRIVQGPENFEPVDGYNTYTELLASVSVLLTEPPKGPAANEEGEDVTANPQQHEPLIVFLPDFDLEAFNEYKKDNSSKEDENAATASEEESDSNEETDTTVSEDEDDGDQETDASEDECDGDEETDGTVSEDEGDGDVETDGEMKRRGRTSSCLIAMMVLCLCLMIWAILF